jgi:hypothetical protein
MPSHDGLTGIANKKTTNHTHQGNADSELPPDFPGSTFKSPCAALVAAWKLQPRPALPRSLFQFEERLTTCNRPEPTGPSPEKRCQLNRSMQHQLIG